MTLCLQLWYFKVFSTNKLQFFISFEISMTALIVFRLNFMLNFVYTFQAIVIFLTGIVSLILAKLELFFVNFSSISNIK